jgi:hypothetical protein
MGTLKSTTDHTGLTVNGCLLGVPVFDETNSMFMWDDNAFPTGTIDPSGLIQEDLIEEAQALASGPIRNGD